MKGIHRFASQRLSNLGNKLFINQQRILKIENPEEANLWSIEELNTSIPIGDALIEKGDVKKISYNDLFRFGFIIASRKPTGKYFQFQKVEYKIVKISSGNDYGSIPPGHHVEYDTLNQIIRIVGKNAGPLGVGPWIPISSTRMSNKEKLDIYSDYDKIKKRLLSRYMTVEEESEFVSIPEIPVMISNKGEVVCINHEGVDEPTICVSGMRGTGKTLLCHSIIDRAYWKGGKRIAILNDSLNQCTSWNLPCDIIIEDGKVKDYEFFSSQLGKLNEHPLPLPCVYLHPNTNTVRELTLPGEGVSFKMSMPFDKVIENYDYFLKGKKEWNLGMSATYFRGIKDSIRDCRTIEEVEAVLDEAVNDELLNKQSKYKILAVVTDIFNQRILDVNTDIEPYWHTETSIESIDMNPVLACMEVGLVPVIMTQNLLSKDYFPQFMKYFIDSIFNYQINVGKRKGYATWIFVDEIADVSSTTNKTVAAESLKRIVTEGRNPKLGTMFATQNWSKIDPLIRNNITYMFAYANKAKEAGEITRDFDLPDHFKKDILNLEKFEMVAMTHEKFICYNSEGERYETSEPITGYAIMPLSAHQAPGG